MASTSLLDEIRENTEALRADLASAQAERDAAVESLRLAHNQLRYGRYDETLRILRESLAALGCAPQATEPVEPGAEWSRMDEDWARDFAAEEDNFARMERRGR